MNKFNCLFYICAFGLTSSCHESTKSGTHQTESHVKKPIHFEPALKTTDVQKIKEIIPPERVKMSVLPNPEPEPLPYYTVEPPMIEPPIYSLTTSRDSIYDMVSVMPEFPGGQQALSNYLKSNLRYPEFAKEMGIEGKIVVSLVIFEDGSVNDVKILRGLNDDYSCEKEALRLIKSMPNWSPGKKENGQTVKVKVRLPILFRLD